MMKAVLLLSSGLDSAANLALARDFEIKLALTIDYGQRSAACEIEHAASLAEYYRVEHQRFELRGLSALIGGKSALLGGQAVPTPESYEALDNFEKATKSAAAVWVPNRNGVMLSIAAALAESRTFDAVAVGFNAEEAVTFADNSRDYMAAMSHSFEFSTANRVKIVSATAEFTKLQIVENLADRGFPFDRLWSCYHAGERHCGRCESCQRLQRALSQGLSQEERERAQAALFPNTPFKREEAQ